MHEALLAPDWLRFGLEQRTRFEHLGNDYRAAASDDSTALVLRTLLAVEVSPTPIVAGIELIDARTYASNGTPLSTAYIDPLELLRAYAGVRHQNVFAPLDQLAITAGRMTLDVGSRRLVARNAFRNTINAFTGVDLQWSSAQEHGLRGFVVLPVNRLPSDPEGLEDHAIELDRETTDALLWGVLSAWPLPLAMQLEGYVLGLHERDHPDFPSANRRLLTPGARLLRPPASGELDFELEVMAQLGKSRASTQEMDTADLDHLALSTHASVGYVFDTAWSPGEFCRSWLTHERILVNLDQKVMIWDNLINGGSQSFGSV
jgi:hypothetical protein